MHAAELAHWERVDAERWSGPASGVLRDGFRPILFCRFIPTAEYVASVLRDRLKGVEVVAVTGTQPPAEREERVAQLAQAERRVLVCTDCLSELEILSLDPVLLGIAPEVEEDWGE